MRNNVLTVSALTIVVLFTVIIGVQKKRSAELKVQTTLTPQLTQQDASSDSGSTPVATQSTYDKTRVLKALEHTLGVFIVRVFAFESIPNGNTTKHIADMMLADTSTTATVAERVECEQSDGGDVRLISRTPIYPVTGSTQTDVDDSSLSHAPALVGDSTPGFPFETPRTYGFVKAQRAKYDFSNISSIEPLPQEDFYDSLAHKRSALALQYN